jgi:hypothetical protein
MYSQSNVDAQFEQIRNELKSAETSRIIAISANRIHRMIYTIKHLYKRTLTAQEREELLYLETYLSDILSSDIGRDDHHLRNAIDGYEQLNYSGCIYQTRAQQRLIELRSVPAYLQLLAARNDIKRMPLIYCKTRNPIAAIVRCNIILDDPFAKPDIRYEALQILIIALEQLGLYKEARHEKQRLSQLTRPTYFDAVTPVKKRIKQTSTWRKKQKVTR